MASRVSRTSPRIKARHYAAWTSRVTIPVPVRLPHGALCSVETFSGPIPQYSLPRGRLVPFGPPSEWQVSNLRPLAPKASALPTAPHSVHKMLVVFNVVRTIQPCLLHLVATSIPALLWLVKSPSWLFLRASPLGLQHFENTTHHGARQARADHAL